MSEEYRMMHFINKISTARKLFGEIRFDAILWENILLCVFVIVVQCDTRYSVLVYYGFCGYVFAGTYM